MSARPNPLSALKLCIRLAKNSKRRLEATVECAQNALETNVRLTLAEREHYVAAITSAKEMLPPFAKIAAHKLPKPPPKTARKIGRPSQKEIDRAEAARRG